MDECMLNDLLECSVCLERLDTSSKVLPCQHTFCKKCLEEIVSTHRELRCPECRVLVDAKIDDLPPNVLLMRILEGMRNANPKGAKTPVRSDPGPQRLFGGHQVAPTPVLATNLSPVVLANDSARHQANASAKQVHLHNQPYGRAIYDYISKVPGDLSFKKGDIVILRKKIDNNWYFGDCGTNHGVFPLSYVQVMTPLPPHVPQCKALYDFRMTNDEEDGCLTFNKGEVISVIRRVDENWAEGKLLDRIGIFPLAFVELNSVARALMKLSTNVQPGPSRVAPPTPTNEETTPLIPTDHSRNVQASSQPRAQMPPAAALPVSDTGSSISPGGSSTTTTTTTTTTMTTTTTTTTTPSNISNSSSTSSNSSTSSSSSTAPSSSSTAPSSPSSPATSPPAVGTRHSAKRHSFTAINTGVHQAHSHHRHSAEIPSPALDSSLLNNTSTSTITTLPTDNTLSQSQVLSGDHSLRHRRSGSSDMVLGQASSNLASNSNSSSNNLPAAYIALYPYKPQKGDELELRKGGIYMVTERCQDGWFKGTSNRTQKCGVFPGNYVAPAKCQRGICRITTTTTTTATTTTTTTGSAVVVVGISTATTTPSTTSISSHQSGALSTSSEQQQRFTVTYGKNKGVAPQGYNIGRSLPPPELPPRAISPSHGVSSSWHGQAQGQSPPRLTEHVVVVNPLGRSHSAVMTSPPIASPGKTMLAAPATPTNCPAASSDMNKSPNNTLRAASSSAGSVLTSSSLKTSDKPKEKKDKGVSLMRRLTNINKKSKSPPPIPYSMDNPVFDDGNFVASLDPVHVRSGSCPSQLLQVGPNQELSAPTNHRLYPTTVQAHVTTSQRIKHKERPSLPVSFLQRSGEAGGGIVAASVGSQHRKSNSLDAGMGKETKQQTSSRERERVYRFRCIVPYPPNSEFELELRVGDIIYVHKKRDDGWYKGTQQRTGRTGLFPASFVEAF